MSTSVVAASSAVGSAPRPSAADSAPVAVAALPPPAWGFQQAPLSVKTMLLYIGLSLGVLLVVTGLLAIFLMACARPNRRRRQAILAALERHRQAALQATKEPEHDFKPQLRPLPIVVVQPGGGEVAFAASLEQPPPQPKALLEPEAGGAGSSSAASLAAPADAEDPELGLPGAAPAEVAAASHLSSSGSSSSSSSAAGSAATAERTRSGGSAASAEQQPSEAEAEEEFFYNPLTHYVTERQAHYFTATVGL